MFTHHLTTAIRKKVAREIDFESSFVFTVRQAFGSILSDGGRAQIMEC